MIVKGDPDFHTDQTEGIYDTFHRNFVEACSCGPIDNTSVVISANGVAPNKREGST